MSGSLVSAILVAIALALIIVPPWHVGLHESMHNGQTSTLSEENVASHDPAALREASEDVAAGNVSTRLCQRFYDALDGAVSDGSGYSNHHNPDGFPTGALLAWSESYLMQSYAEMYRATGEIRYVQSLRDHILAILDNRDDKRGIDDYRGRVVPAWGTDRFTRAGDWKHFSSHTGMITYPMLEFVKRVRDYQITDMLGAAEVVLVDVEESVAYHDAEWVIQESGLGLYTFSEEYYGIENYICPLSQQACIGRSLLLLWNLTREESYYAKVSAIAEAIRSSFCEGPYGEPICGVFPGGIGDGNPVADISHCTMTIHFMELCVQEGIVFSEADLEAMAQTILRLLQQEPVPSRLDGSGDGSLEIAAAQYSFLARYSPEIRDLCHRLLFERYRVDITGALYQEDWWGTVMLSLARLVGVGSMEGALDTQEL